MATSTPTRRRGSAGRTFPAVPPEMEVSFGAGEAGNPVTACDPRPAPSACIAAGCAAAIAVNDPTAVPAVDEMKEFTRR